MEDSWLSVEEIGEYLGVKRDTVYRWITEKNMPVTLCVRIDFADFQFQEKWRKKDNR
jgi:excisionase family DNA binding protein